MPQLSKALLLPPQIITAGPDDVPALAKITADAFHDDPVNAWVFRSFEGMHLTFQRLAQHVYIPRGMCHIIEGKAAAMWMLPERSTEPPLTAMAAMAFFGMRHGGIGSLVRMLAFASAAEKAHPKAPHLYLFTVGVRPQFKGQGYGKKILTPVLNAADNTGLPIYLENSKPDNHGFYRSLGFERQTIFHPKPNAPPLEAMWREPR